MNIANEICGYSKGVAMGRFKQLRKGVKMDGNTEDDATSVPLSIMEHYRDVHLDKDISFVNKIPFLLTKSRYIGFIHCKAMLSKHDDGVQKGLQAIVIDYQSRGFKVVSAFGEGAFEPIIDWARQELH